MKLSHESAREEMERIVEATKRIVVAKGEAWPTLFMFRDHSLGIGMEEKEPWAVPDVDLGESQNFVVSTHPCDPIRSDKDLQRLHNKARIMALSKSVIGAGVVMNILFADPDTDKDSMSSSSGARPAIYVGYYTKHDRQIHHKMIPYYVAGELTAEEKEEALEELREVRGEEPPAALIPKYSVSFVDDLDWDPEEYGPEVMLPNPWLTV